MRKILVSACLLGDPVRYDGRCKALENDAFDNLFKHNRIIKFCPEMAGGLPVPRDAAEIELGDGFSVIDKTSRVKTNKGNDVTDSFLEGAYKALELCQKHNITVAIMTEFSPSCGSNHIYDGSFKRVQRNGVGVTTALLKQHGVAVFNQHHINEALKALHGRS